MMWKYKIKLKYSNEVQASQNYTPVHMLSKRVVILATTVT